MWRAETIAEDDHGHGIIVLEGEEFAIFPIF